MEPNRTDASILLPTLVVALGALLVFTSTLSFYPFPGESAAMVARYGGIDPLPTAYHPLYALVAQLFARLPMGTLAFRIGLISSLSGSACVALLFIMMARLRFRQVHDDEAPLLSFVTGLPAAGYLLLAPPFWASANRAHPVLFHLCFLLLALMLVQRYGHTGRVRFLHGASFLFGLFLLEWAGNMLTFPFVVAAVVLFLHANAHLQEDHANLPIASFTAGVVSFIALFYARLAWATANLVDPPTLQLGRALFTLIGEHLFLLEREMHGVDMMLIAIGSVVPWLVAMVCARKESETEAYSGSIVLHIVLSLLCLILLFLGSVSPAMFSDLHSLAAVPPIVAIASVFGYVVGYWYILADRAWGEQPAVMARVLALLGVTVCGILLTAGIINAERISTRIAEATHQWAAAVLHPLAPDAVVIAPANEQNILTITAREQGHAISPIDLTREADPEYRSYIADTLAPPDLRDLAELSLPHFLEIWTQHPLYPADRVLTTEDPAFFTRFGRAYQPALTGYLDVSSPQDLWDHALLEQHQAFWDRVVPALASHRSFPGFPGDFCRSLVNKASRTANDLALLARAHGNYNDAHLALQAARAMEFNNLHAAANQFLLLTQIGHSDEAASSWSAIDALVASGNPRADRSEQGKLLGATRLYTFADVRGHTKERLPDSPAFHDALAAYVMHEASNPDTGSLELTREHPDNADAWLLAALMAVDTNDTNRFDECTAQLAALNADSTPLAIAAARQAIERNDIAWARQLMQGAVTRQPADISVLETIASMEVLAPTPATEPVYLHRLLSLDPGNSSGHYALGARLLLQGERARARQEFDAAADRGDDPRASLLAALMADRPDEPVSHQTRRLGLGTIDADIDDPHYWNALQGLFTRMEFPGAATYATAKAGRLTAETPADQAFARLIEATLPPGPIDVASTTPGPVPSVPEPPSLVDEDLRVLLNKVVNPNQTPSPEPAGTLPAQPPPSDTSDFDDEAAPVPLAW